MMEKMMKTLVMEQWEFNPHGNDEWIGGLRAIGYRNWQGTCIGVIVCMWNTRMSRWLGWEITWSGDLDIITCRDQGVAYWMSTIFPSGVMINLGECFCRHTKNMMWSGRCIKDTSQQSWMMRKLLVMYTWYVHTLSSSHGEWHHGCTRTLLVGISHMV
jgi:hypothetical protein